MAGETTGIDALTGIRKAAVLLIILGDKASAELIKELNEDEVQLVFREVALVNTITPDLSEAVLEEFYQMSLAREYALVGGIDYAKKMLFAAFAPDQAKKVVDRIKSMGPTTVNFGVLQKADPQRLAKFVHSEHPQTIALILSHLNPSQAAALLISLPVKIRSDVALRMANLDQISPEVISKIATVIGSKLEALGEFSGEAYGGVRAVAEMLNRLDSVTSKEILERVEQEDMNMVETIRHLMFVFEDLLMINANGLKEVLAKIDRKVLTVALKGTSDQLRNHFLQGMSQRGAEMLREDMESMGPVKIKDVESAQQQIIALVRQLEAEGTISLKGAVGEQYVV